MMESEYFPHYDWYVLMRYFRRDILSKNSADPSICRCLNGFLSGLFINIHKMFYEIDLIALHDSIPGNIFFVRIPLCDNP